MAAFSFDSASIWFNDLDFADYSDTIALDGEAGDLDVSTFSSGTWREFIQGSPMVSFDIGGPWGFADPDDELWTHVSTDQTDPLLTVSPTGTAGDPAYILEPRGLQRTTGGSYGEVPRWNLTGKSAARITPAATSTAYRYGWARGAVSLAKQTITGDVNGSAFNLSGGIGVTDMLVVALHVFTDNATSLDVIIESDDNSDFSSPTTLTTIAVSSVGTTTYAALGALLSSADYFRARTANLVGTNWVLGCSIGYAPGVIA